MTEGIGLAQQAQRTCNYASYGKFEADTINQVGVVAAAFYTLAAIAWTGGFVGARTWSSFLTWLSVVTWGVMLIVTVGPWLSEYDYPSTSKSVSAGNAVGFVLMMLWFVLVTEKVLRRSRPDEPYGRMAPWRSPYWKPFGPLLDLIANSRLIRAFGELLPTPAFVSDITDVI